MTRRPTVLLLLLLVSPLAAVFGVCAFGPPGPLAGAGAVVRALAEAGTMPLLYLLAALGFGRLFTRVAERGTVGAALGLGVMLTLSHLLGVLGLFGGPAGPYVALSPVIAGVLLLFLRSGATGESRPLHVFVWMLMLGLAAVPFAIACNPPGWLWESEFGGYDALSYHLQLPQEWLAMGRIAPLDHNVYSYLPGYMESAFTHLGAISFAPTYSAGAGPLDVPAWGLVAGSGWRLLSCQLLHAGCAVFAAWSIAGLCARAVAQGAPAGSGGSVDSASAERGTRVLAFLFALGTPWVLVTGTLAYNEMPMIAFFAAACSAALSDDAPYVRRWCVAGALVAFAACVKPTAIVLCGGPVGLLLLATTPARKWLVAGLVASAVGLVILLPWLIRNALASGNPVFPFAAGLFANAAGGTGHWTAEQVARYHAGHAFSGSLLSRLALMVMPDQTDPAGPRMRGLLHPQWMLVFPAAAISLIVCLVRRVPRAGLWGASLGLIIVLWLFATHVQSRFLMPALVPACVLFSLALSGAGSIGRALGRLAVLAQWAASLVIFGAQRGDSPNMWLELGPNYRSAECAREELRDAGPETGSQWLAEAPPEVYCNLALPPGATLRLIGGATPLYHSRRPAYNTTWDTAPIAAVLAGTARPDAEYLLVDFAEIERLSRSGWMDPGITPERLADWLRDHTDEVRSWRDIGVVLVKVRGGAIS